MFPPSKPSATTSSATCALRSTASKEAAGIRVAVRTGDGPAIIEERESTTIIGPGAILQVDERLTLVARLL